MSSLRIRRVLSSVLHSSNVRQSFTEKATKGKKRDRKFNAIKLLTERDYLKCLIVKEN